MLSAGQPKAIEIETPSMRQTENVVLKFLCKPAIIIHDAHNRLVTQCEYRRDPDAEPRHDGIWHVRLRQ